MNILTAAILGIVQGLTEFLPISSSGHLILARSFFTDFSQPGVLFDVVLHGGTLLAVLIYFRKRLIRLSHTELQLLAIGTIPAVVVGFLFDDLLEAMFSDVKSVGIQLIITGFLCFLIDRAGAKREVIKKADAFLIGIAQAIAIVPGISRSGATIYAATARGINRAQAAEFSFLLSIPAIAGAILFQFLKYGGAENISVVPYAAGFLTSLFFGVFSIRLLLKLLVSKNFKVFAVYSVLLGTLVWLTQ